MKKIRTTFLTGLLVLVPLIATVDILRWAVTALDSFVEKYLPAMLVPLFPGRGVMLLIVSVFIIGALTQNIVGIWVVQTFDHLLRRLPFVGGLYGGIKKFLETVLNPSNDKFSHAVLVEFPVPGSYSIGFRTGDPDPKLRIPDEKGLVNVFIPMVPNPTAGFYFLAKEKDLIKLDMTVQEAFKIAISMGVMGSSEASEITGKNKKR